MVLAQVLVVDANATVRKLAVDTLRNAGFSVLGTKNTDEGKDALLASDPAVVVVDLATLSSSKLALEELLALDVKGLRRHWVVTHDSSFCPSDVAGRTQFDWLCKPFVPAALLRRVHAYAEPIGDAAAVSQDIHFRLPSSAAYKHPTSLEQAKPSYLEAWLIRLAEGLASGAPPSPSANPMNEASIQSWLREGFSTEHLRTLSYDLSRLTQGTACQGSLEGRIDHAPLMETLQMLQIQAQTGTLNIHHGDQILYVCLRNGQVDMVVSEATYAEFFLGRYLVEQGAIGREELERVLEQDGEELQQLLGKRLLDKAAISPSDLKAALKRQTTDLMCEALRWHTGTFRFDKETVLPVAELARLELPMQSLLLEGVRRLDEWHLIERRVPDLNVVFAPSGTPQERLEPGERRVLEAVDGKSTVRSIIESTSMRTFEVCRILQRFADQGWLSNHTMH
ncbi:MAG: DUF4388 domain-containing protein [Myxococcales bacterium]|nr:DUF4388 domain-containing protein [Myxococcales bacterium]MCB9708033.1 DUF4388 domain-containing protein [Myxococcales bacterium]